MSFDISKAALTNVFSHSSDCIFIIDKEWKIVDMNSVAETVSGWRKSEVRAMRLCKESFAAIIIKNDIDKQILEERLLSLERLDPLTQLYHRQYFEDLFNIEAKRLQRHGGTLALLMLDVEGLRELNSRYGHRIGDDVLRGIGKVIKKTIREVDIASRYGDDEYLILLYGVDEIKGQTSIHRLRENMNKWNQSETVPVPVKLNMCLLVEDREFQSVLQKIKNIIDERKGIPL